VVTKTTAENPITLGDPVPWFTAPLIAGGSFILNVHAGRWIGLCFFGSPANPRVNDARATLRLLAFLYAEADAARRQANNTRLHDGETLYTGAGDRLISEKAASSNE
jgi:hypothetical protein